MIAPRVIAHYAPEDPTAAILAALRAAGKAPDYLTPDDLAPLDQFHFGGARATRDLAQLADVRAEMRVLDVGGGIGGPARTLASQFGCTVTVLDLTEAYCRVGAWLTARTALADRVVFQQGDALALPFADGQFDLVWTQHSSMNIADKARLYAEMHRVLRSGGRFALFEAMAGPVQPPHFPVPWARDPATSFLLPPDESRRLIAAAGFREATWVDATAAMAQANANRPSASGPATTTPLGIHLLLGPDFGAMARNYARNIAEGRVVIIQGVFDRN